jgi:TRAP-type uncharacterized transport system substrate-binding protein
VKKTALVAGLLIFGAAAAQAEGDFTISTGPGSGVYTQAVANMQEVCPDAEIIEVKSSGAPENLENCLLGKVTACFVNADQMWGAKNIEGRDAEVENIKTILPFYDNAIHMISRNPAIVNFSDLNGKVIGISGGAAVTLRVMLAKSERSSAPVRPTKVVNFDREKDPQKAMLDAWNAGKVDAIVGIGYAPIPWVEKINLQDAHLVAYDRWNDVKDLSIQNGGFYRMKTIGYKNLEGNASTLTVRTILASARNWPANAPETKQIQKLFACMTKDSTRQTLKSGAGRNFHPFWITYSPMTDPAWPWYGNLKPAGKK